MYIIEKPKDEIYCCYFDRFHLRLTIKRVAENEKEFIIFLLLYNGIRIFAFGLHAKKSSWCLISSIIFFIVLPIILKFIIINKFVISILGSILLINYYKYSPADTRKRPIVNVKIRLKYKYLSCIIVIIYLFIALIINNIYISNLLFSAVLFI